MKHYVRAYRKGALTTFPTKTRERMSHFSVLLPESMEAELRRRARITGKSYSEIVREALSALLGHAG